MANIDLEKYKMDWKNDSSKIASPLSQDEIKSYLSGSSRDIGNLFRKGLLFDIVLKAIITVSLVVLLVIYWQSPKPRYLIMFSTLSTIAALAYQYKSLGLIPVNKPLPEDIRSSLNNRIEYYYNRHIRSLINGGFSNTLIILTGSLFYFYFKYGGIRKMDNVDYIVFGLAFIISFLFGSLVQIYHHNFHIRQLKECLDDIDDDIISKQKVEKARNKKRRITWIGTLAIICGLLLLSYLIFM